MESLRLLAHIGASLYWDMQQWDIKTAYLHGVLDEPCYMSQPKGFEEPGKEDWVWKLKKGLYGMKQGGRTWYQTMHKAMIEWGFTRLNTEHCVYHRTGPTGTVITAIHVDDFTSIASSKEENERFKAQICKKWDISDLGDIHFVVGIAAERDRKQRTVKLSQTALIYRVVSQFGLASAYPSKTPLPPNVRLSKADSPKTDDEKAAVSHLPFRQLVGSLMYIAIGTRPDIAHAVQQLSQFNDCFGRTHWEHAKHVVRYLKGTRTYSHRSLYFKVMF
jgi:Reverse transcriptase (RNA-dependent DNA polymerase)